MRHTFFCSSRARAGRCGLGAHTVAVGALRPLRCDARAGGAPQNSLRSRCSLRSNSCGEHVDVARCACLPRPCASRRHRDRPQPTPPSASLYKRWSACGGVPSASAVASASGLGIPTPLLPRRVGPGLGAPLGRRVAQGLRPRAQRASLTDSSRLFERRARSAQSEFCDGPHDRATQGSHRAVVTAPVKRPAQGPRALAARNFLDTEH